MVLPRSKRNRKTVTMALKSDIYTGEHEAYIYHSKSLPYILDKNSGYTGYIGYISLKPL